MAIGTLIKALSKRIKNAKEANIIKNGINKAGLKPHIANIPTDITRANFSILASTTVLPSQLPALFKRSTAIKSVQGAKVSSVLPSTKNIDGLANKGFNQIKGYKPQSKFSSNTKIEDVEKAIEQSDTYSDVINIVYNGLEALKLGHITLDFKISGDIEHNGILGVSSKDGMKRSILELTHNARLTSLTINAFSYRGFRSKDPDQGIGIDKIKHEALSQLKKVQ